MIKEAILYDAFLMTQLKGMLLVLVFFCSYFGSFVNLLFIYFFFFPSSSNLINFGPSVCSRWMNDKAINNFHRPYQRCVIIRKKQNRIYITFCRHMTKKKLMIVKNFNVRYDGQRKSFGKSTRVNIFLPFFFERKNGPIEFLP